MVHVLCLFSRFWVLDLQALAVTTLLVCCSYNINDEGTPGEGFAIVTATPCNITVRMYTRVWLGAQFDVARCLCSFFILAEQQCSGSSWPMASEVLTASCTGPNITKVFAAYWWLNSHTHSNVVF